MAEILEWQDVADLDQLAILLDMQGQTAGVKLQSLIIQLKSSGMSDETIIRTIAEDFEQGGRIFGSIINQFTATTGAELDNITQGGTDFDDDALLTWLVTSGNPCKDCAPRHLKAKLYYEWQAIGLPGVGWSDCNYYCMCVLVQKQFVPDDFGKPIEVPSLTEVRKKFIEDLEKYPEYAASLDIKESYIKTLKKRI